MFFGKPVTRCAQVKVRDEEKKNVSQPRESESSFGVDAATARPSLFLVATGASLFLVFSSLSKWVYCGLRGGRLAYAHARLSREILTGLPFRRRLYYLTAEVWLKEKKEGVCVVSKTFLCVLELLHFDPSSQRERDFWVGSTKGRYEISSHYYDGNRRVRSWTKRMWNHVPGKFYTDQWDCW